MLPHTPFAPQMPIKTPCCPLGYKFTLQDYVAYTFQYRCFLLNPRACSALMKGGYIWQVAIPAVSIVTVINGPSGWSTNPDEMFIALLPELSDFVDDELTDSDCVASITARLVSIYIFSYSLMTYHDFLGYGEQMLSTSWCPLPGTFENSGLDYGQWTSVNEDQFMIASQTADGLKRQPCTTKKWRNIARGLGKVWRGTLRLKEECQALLKSNI